MSIATHDPWNIGEQYYEITVGDRRPWRFISRNEITAMRAAQVEARQPGIRRDAPIHCYPVCPKCDKPIVGYKNGSGYVNEHAMYQHVDCEAV